MSVHIKFTVIPAYSAACATRNPRGGKRIVPFLRYDVLLIAAFIRQSNEFIRKVVKLPKDACKVRTKYNHIFLKKVAVSLRLLLQDCFTTPTTC